MDDVLIIGGGVIGLSLAWDLARHGRQVHVIDRGNIGQEASWAGAGILPPMALRTNDHPAEQLRGLACQLHPEWAKELREITGIDTGYRECGGLYLARTVGEAAALAAWMATLEEEGIAIKQLRAAELANLEPGLANPYTGSGHIKTALLLPTEAQLRNPRHLKALAAACQKAGVTITPQVEAADFAIRGSELNAVQIASGPLRAKQYVFAAGAWTGKILQRLDIATGILPIRGQIVLFRCDQPPISRIVNEGSRYLVPRDDGRVLAGSTEEEAGFDKRTTDTAITELTEFACGLVPALNEATIERTWAGLRPGSFDGLPYLGRLPGLQNAFVAAGHFRTGLYLSPATAVVMSQLMRGEQPQIDLTPFRVGR